MVRLAGLEPARIKRQILSLLWLPITSQSHGLPYWTRTSNLQLRRLLLFPVELRADYLSIVASTAPFAWATISEFTRKHEFGFLLDVNVLEFPRLEGLKISGFRIEDNHCTISTFLSLPVSPSKVYLTIPATTASRVLELLHS